MTDPIPSGSSVKPPAPGTVPPPSAGLAQLQSSADGVGGLTLQRKVTITNAMGFHLRPIAMFARLAAQFQSTVTLSKGSQRVNGRSALEMMMLAAEQGTELVLEVSGPDAPTALEALSEILAAPAMDEESDPAAPPNT